MPIAPITADPLVVDLLRHGQTQRAHIVRGSIDDPLSPEGHRQMHSALGGEQWEHIVYSPLSRCRAFAEHCAEAWQAPSRAEERLREYHFGAWEGCTWQKLWQKHPNAVQAFFTDPDNHPPPGGEIYAEFRARVLDAWEDLLTGATHKRTLVITHGGVLMLILAHVLGANHLGGRIELGFAARACVHVCSQSREARLKRYVDNG